MRILPNVSDAAASLKLDTSVQWNDESVEIKAANFSRYKVLSTEETKETAKAVAFLDSHSKHT